MKKLFSWINKVQIDDDAELSISAAVGNRVSGFEYCTCTIFPDSVWSWDFENNLPAKSVKVDWFWK